MGNANEDKERLHILVGADEKARWEKAAQRLGLTLSSWVRLVLNQRIERIPPPQKVPEQRETEATDGS